MPRCEYNWQSQLTRPYVYTGVYTDYQWLIYISIIIWYMLIICYPVVNTSDIQFIPHHNLNGQRPLCGCDVNLMLIYGVHCIIYRPVRRAIFNCSHLSDTPNRSMEVWRDSSDSASVLPLPPQHLWKHPLWQRRIISRALSIVIVSSSILIEIFTGRWLTDDTGYQGLPCHSVHDCYISKMYVKRPYAYRMEVGQEPSQHEQHVST